MLTLIFCLNLLHDFSPLSLNLQATYSRHADLKMRLHLTGSIALLSMQRDDSA